MKKQILILLVIATAFLSACTDPDEFLDVKPTGTLIPQTVEDFDKLLEAPATSYTTWYNMTYMDPDTWMPGKNYQDMYQNKWKRQYEWAEDHLTAEEDDSDWINRYTMIHVYNLVIDEVDGAALGKRTESDRKRVKGEAYAQRALDFFILVNEYGAHISSSTQDAPGIPMPLTIDLAAQLPRSTVGEVYEQILSDLDQAEIFLADAPIYNEKANFRPGKAAMKALHALANLYVGNFEEAKKYSNEALDLYDFVYDFTTISNKTEGDAWSGLDMYDFDYSTDAKSVLWNRYHRWTYYDPAQLYHPDLIALFDQSNDQRFILFSSNHTYYGDDVSPNFAYARYFAESQSGITVPNLILVNAEAKARTGDGPGAMEALNKLLVKRLINFTPLVHTDAATTLQTVKNERRKELMATGNNLIDLKRYHAYGETVPTFTRTLPDGQVFTLEPGSSKYIVPISKKIKSFNPNL
ncbi:MAG: RagB/SusD family nutrient uptake outer membrane protein [Flavobacteriaceae bacterium]|nr:RagB/SusD family nutrient uptake outer membrane protein [Flavobacteriaceae bacterium]